MNNHRYVLIWSKTRQYKTRQSKKQIDETEKLRRGRNVILRAVKIENWVRSLLNSEEKHISANKAIYNSRNGYVASATPEEKDIKQFSEVTKTVFAYNDIMPRVLHFTRDETNNLI